MSDVFEQIEKAAEQATPRPWTVEHPSHVDDEHWVTIMQGAWDISHNRASQDDVVADSKYSAMSAQENEANAELIVLATEAAPRLVAALRKAEAALEGIVYISDAGLIDTTHKDERGNLARDIEQAREALAAIKAAREGREP